MIKIIFSSKDFSGEKVLPEHKSHKFLKDLYKNYMIRNKYVPDNFLNVEILKLQLI